MNWEDQDIDNLFRDAGSGNVPPFDESFWSEMEEMLPDDGKGVDSVFVNASLSQAVPPYRDAYWKEMQAMLPGKKRRIAAFWWYGAAGAVLFAIGLGFWYTGNNNLSGSQITGENSTANKNYDTPAREAENIPQKSDQPIADGKSQKIPCDVYFSLIKSAVEKLSENHVLGNHYLTEPADLNPSEALLTVDSLEKLQTGVSYNMARASYDKPVAAKAERLFYVQAGAGLGQSFIRNAPGSDLVHFYAIGGGIQKQLGSMYVSFGLNGRADFVSNLHHDVFAAGSSNRSELKQLYAIETPLVLAFGNGKNRFGGILTPGFQVGYTGTYVTYDQDQNVTARGRESGKMPQSRTLTMEVGFIYLRRFSDKWSGGCEAATGIITPPGEAPYLGTIRSFPVNGSFFIRRNF